MLFTEGGQPMARVPIVDHHMITSDSLNLRNKKFFKVFLQKTIFFFFLRAMEKLN